MSSDNTIDALNELVAMHYKSLPVYLTYASPTWHRGDDLARETLATVSQDQQETADRLAAMVVEGGGVVDNGKFPIYYTGYHDLSFGFLLTKVIEEQRQDIATIEHCVAELVTAPLAKAAAQEALGAAKGHLESLEELRQASAAS